VETGSYRDILNRVLVVDCDEALQIERVMRRDGLARDEVQAILAAQATRAERLAAADDVIQNQDAPERPCAAVADLHRRYLVLAAA
jgi:dephospho-CoA kinase